VKNNILGKKENNSLKQKNDSRGNLQKRSIRNDNSDNEILTSPEDILVSRKNLHEKDEVNYKISSRETRSHRRRTVGDPLLRSTSTSASEQELSSLTPDLDGMLNVSKNNQM